ncbi:MULTISPECIES: rRNA maturation RNase YbeY [unclassified Lactococcus]|uniref:rRNA maturation RNase YbeY n=1 Tax=unclassified Lactococcus TaxID=2643510 RepID=UPI0011CB32C1|nr:MULTISPECIES: rRNA maturation RNase YbeY [unclassified Lactococcus]MQW23126.1 rRNA maturation RNase YbeY [Lactococcus sp. dk101]TXK44180.1 rRNA maturation RNase YbeY [Lactococcus sp. dk310]TXK49911.1 rRNA maturation RNase YbeY [Lactococcus sp. dk322]
MYVEMTDETGKVPAHIIEQSEKLLDYAAEYIHLPESKEMAVTFVDNERSHALNLEYRDTDRPTDVISLEYKPDDEELFFDEDMEIPEELLEELDPFIGELYISIDKAAEQAQDYGHSIEREYGWLVVHGFLHINGYDHYTPEEEAEMFGLQEEILTAYGLTR